MNAPKRESSLVAMPGVVEYLFMILLFVILFLTKSLDLDRFCLPSTEELKNATGIIFDNYFGDGLTKYMGDLVVAWWLILVMAGITLVLSMIYLFLLRCIAKPLLYISFILILVLFVAGGFYVFF